MKSGLVVRLISTALLLTALPVLGSDAPALAAPAPQAPLPPQPPSSPPPGVVKHPKFATSIALVAAAAAEALAAAPMSVSALASAYPDVRAYFDTGLLRLDAQGRLEVYIRVGEITQAGAYSPRGPSTPATRARTRSSCSAAEAPPTTAR